MQAKQIGARVVDATLREREFSFPYARQARDRASMGENDWTLYREYAGHDERRSVAPSTCWRFHTRGDVVLVVGVRVQQRLPYRSSSQDCASTRCLVALSGTLAQDRERKKVKESAHVREGPSFSLCSTNCLL